MRERFDTELIPDILRSRKRPLDTRAFKQMRLPKYLQETRLCDLRSPMIEPAQNMVRMLDTIVGPMARIQIVHGGIHGQHTQYSAGYMKLAQMFGFLTLWLDISEVRSFDSPMVDEDRTVFESSLEVDLLVVDCSSIQDIAAKKTSPVELRRTLRRRILENRSTILNLTCSFDSLTTDERASLSDLLLHSADRVLFFNTETGLLQKDVLWT